LHDEPYDYHRFSVYGLRALFPAVDWEILWSDSQSNFLWFVVLSLNLFGMHLLDTASRRGQHLRMALLLPFVGLAVIAGNTLASLFGFIFPASRFPLNQCLILKKRQLANESGTSER
jgi:hypothetical protein